MGIGDWPNPQSPIPNPQSPNKSLLFYCFLFEYNNYKCYLINKYNKK